MMTITYAERVIHGWSNKRHAVDINFMSSMADHGGHKEGWLTTNGGLKEGLQHMEELTL